MGNVLEINKDNFDSEVKQADVPVLVDFWAPWCGPCRALAPVIEELAQEYGDKVKICKINTDENVELAQQYRVSGIPSLMFLKNGEVVEQLVGVQQKSTLVEKLNAISNN